MIQDSDEWCVPLHNNTWTWDIRQNDNVPIVYHIHLGGKTLRGVYDGIACHHCGDRPPIQVAEELRNWVYYRYKI